MTRRVRASACLLASLLAGAAGAAAQTRPLTTAEVVQLALARNRDLTAARERVAEARGLLRQAGVRLAPTVEVEAATGRPLGTHGEEEFTAGYFQPIETAGKRGKRITVSGHNVAVAEAELAAASRQVIFDVKTRVAEIQAARRKLQAIGRLIDASRQSHALTQARVSEGDAAVLEERLLATEISRGEAQKATLTGRLASALADLGRVIGEPLLGTFALAEEAPTPLSLSLDQLKARASGGRPELLIARAQEDEASAELALARAEGIPDLTASARYARRNTQFEGVYGFTSSGALSPLRDRDNVLVVGVAIPLFTAGRNRGNVEAASAMASAARLHREYLETTVPLDVEAAFRHVSAAQEAIGLFQSGVIDESQRNLDVIRQAYGLGQLRLIDVLNEQRRLVDTELAFIDVQTELAEATADLERAVGADLP